jgi:hypothetical protein
LTIGFMARFSLFRVRSAFASNQQDWLFALRPQAAITDISRILMLPSGQFPPIGKQGDELLAVPLIPIDAIKAGLALTADRRGEQHCLKFTGLWRMPTRCPVFLVTLEHADAPLPGAD